MLQPIRRKMRLSLFGQTAAPKLFTALQIAYGLCGDWNRIMVLSSSGKADRYQTLGPYQTFDVHPLSTPERYASLLNIVQSCRMDVIILDNFSDEWRHGVSAQLNDFNYQDVLNAHRTLMKMIRFSAEHIICCVDTERKLSYRDREGNRKLHYSERPVQQEGIDRYFMTVLSLDRKGNATVLKDLTNTLPENKPFKITPQVGALLQDFCCEGQTVVPRELQNRINSCESLGELYTLMFSEECSDVEMIGAFTKRRLELEDQHQRKLESSEYPF
jgi:hypothetical protein